MGIVVTLAGIALIFVSGYWRWCAHSYPGDPPHDRSTPARCTFVQHLTGCLGVALIAGGVWLYFD